MANRRLPGAQDELAGPNEPDTDQLTRLIAAYAPHDGSFELRIPGLHANRFSRPNKECVHALRLPSLCIAAQGAKTVIVGDEVYEYDASRMIVFSVALPVAAQVTQASHSAPYLSLKLDLDPHKIAELVLKVYPHGLPPVQERSAVYVTPVDASVVNAATRFFFLTFALYSPTMAAWRSHAGSAKCMTSSPALWRSMDTLRRLKRLATGWTLTSLATVHKHITNLEKKGLLTRDYNRSRSIDLLPPKGRLKQAMSVNTGLVLPLLGRIAAGQPIEACRQ
jgi:hypothetical protein